MGKQERKGEGFPIKISQLIKNKKENELNPNNIIVNHPFQNQKNITQKRKN